MNIDQRLDRLTERHEALTQSVELLFKQSQEHDQQLARVISALGDLVAIVRSHEDRLDRLEGQ